MLTRVFPRPESLESYCRFSIGACESVDIPKKKQSALMMPAAAFGSSDELLMEPAIVFEDATFSWQASFSNEKILIVACHESSRIDGPLCSPRCSPRGLLLYHPYVSCINTCTESTSLMRLSSASSPKTSPKHLQRLVHNEHISQSLTADSPPHP